MPYYKAQDNSLHFLENTAFEYLLPEGCVQISDEDAEFIRISNIPETNQEESVVADPVAKLKTFLAENPDVASLLNQ